jgi:glycosyl transferase, family 25
MLEAFDRIRVINLRARSDRRKQMIQELSRLGLAYDQRVEFFEAVVPLSEGKWASLGEHGCFMSHLSVLQDAMSAGESVLILEDDCDFTTAALTSPWGKGCDIFYGGFSAPDYSQLEKGNIQGAHCMGFSQKVVAPLVSFLVGVANSASPAPIDGAYVDFRRSHPQFVTEFALPQVAVQRQSPSDISPGRFDKNKWLQLGARVFRKLNRRRYRAQKMNEGLR